MLRRNARLRREYLYRKSLEGKEKQVYENKKKIKEAIADGKPIPTELRNASRSLLHDIDMDDAQTGATVHTHIDDEYQLAGVYDPKLMITTSREPSSRLAQFSKELRLVFPNSTRINRGKTTVSELVTAARSQAVTDLIILHEHRGEPDGMIVSHLPHGPTAYFGLRNVVLRHDLTEAIGTMSEAYPHLIFDNFSTPLGERIKNVLKYLFPVPKHDAHRVMTFSNRNDTISFRHHVFKKNGYRDIELGEVGPRFEMVLYQLKLGSVDMAEAENEWVLRPYMNTAKKRKAL